MGLVENWLEGLAVDGRQSYLSGLRLFEAWLKERDEFASIEEAVAFQKRAVGDERYRIGDLLLQHVRERGGTYKGMIWRYAAVRSFFMHVRAELPRVKVNLQPSRDATVGRLNLEAFHILLKSSSLRDQAIYLSCFQGLIDQHRFFRVLNPKGFELGEHIREKGTDAPFRVDFLRGRKRNMRAYNSWIGHDSLTAWKVYFERERGYPSQGESAALGRYKKPLTKSGFLRSHGRRLRKLRYVKGFGTKATRYGYNLHELRDLARSLLEKAKADNFNVSSAEHWMGHSVDPLFYNKIWKLDEDYNLSQYRIAEKYLNILSTPVETEQIQQQEERIQSLEKQLADMRQMIQAGIKQLQVSK